MHEDEPGDSYIDLDIKYLGKHPSHVAILKFFSFHHLPLHLQEVSKQFYKLADWLSANVNEGGELTTGLRKLLEAKDCAIRASLVK